MITDTIYAKATALGFGARGLVRISGPEALRIGGLVLGRREGLPRTRAAIETQLTLREGAASVLVLMMPRPASLTGEDVVEIHGPGSALWIARLGSELQALGARLAEPGEFTRRAVENGKASLADAEALLALIEAETESERRFAREALRGSLSALAAGIADRIVLARSILESGLDFTDGETGDVAGEEWLPAVRLALGDLHNLLANAPAGRSAGALMVVGAANAGKSSLCNALAGRDVVLVSERAGTTRDVVPVEISGGGRLLDSPGDLASVDGVDVLALALRDRLGAGAAGALLVVDATAPSWVARAFVPIAVVFTKCDLAEDDTAVFVPREFLHLPVFRTSARTGQGLEQLRAFLSRSALPRNEAGAALLLGHCEAAADCLTQAIELGESGAGPELAAVELGRALEHLEILAGRISPEHFLDAIFARFCLGK